jgi:hypothetical protein
MELYEGSSFFLFCFVKCKGSRDSVGSIVTRLWAGQPRVRILAGARDSLLQNVQTGCGAYPASYPMGTGVLFWNKASRAWN